MRAHSRGKSLEPSQVDLTVVFAVSVDADSRARALAALEAACAGISTEFIVVHPGRVERGARRPADAGRISSVQRPPGTLTPVLWGAGAALARAPRVAFTTTQMRVAAGWARALATGVTSPDAGDTVGAAGPIALGRGADGATAATYFVRFSAFLPESVAIGGGRRTDIPGDNAAYDRAAVARHGDLLREGFWEVEFHRRFAREGLMLTIVPGATATMVGPTDFGAVVAQRFAHATAFGRSRVGRHGESIVRIVLGAPVVPVVLLLRIVRRVLPHARYRSQLVRALPWLLVLAAAWALGEAVGALRRGPGSSVAAP